MGFAGQEGLYISILVSSKGNSVFKLTPLRSWMAPFQILLVISGFFCIVGGLTAVIWTDFIQTILMVIGAFILMGMSKTQWKCEIDSFVGPSQFAFHDSLCRGGRLPSHYRPVRRGGTFSGVQCLWVGSGHPNEQVRVSRSLLKMTCHLCRVHL